eukprot:gene1295-1880_t
MKVPGLISWKLLESTRLEINSVTQAFSELVDNTRDVAVQHNKKFSFWIDFRFAPGSSRVPSEIHCWDDGPGVPREHVQEMLGFGFSDKGADMIGQYGLGVKHACMRLARSTLIFIKTTERAVVLLMSPAFLESKGIKEIEYPECAFDELLGKYCLRHTDIGTAEDIIAHSSLESVESMVSILENMPRTGIKYVMYQLRESKEMDIGTDPSDLIVMNADGSRLFTQARPGQAYSALLREDYSLRSYLEVLYQGTPLVNIHLRGQRVAPRDPHAMLKEQVQRFRLEVRVPTETGAGASIHNATVHVAELSLGYTDDATARHFMQYGGGRLSGRAPLLGGVNMYSKNRLCQLYMRIGLQLFNTNGNVGKDILGVLSADFLTLNRSKTAFAHNAFHSRLQEAIKEAMQRYHANMQTRSTAGVKAGTQRIPLHPGVEVIRVPKQRGRVITGDGALPHQPALGSGPVQQNTGHRQCGRPGEEGGQSQAGSSPEQQNTGHRKGGRPGEEACEGTRAASESWRMSAPGAHGVPSGCAGDGGDVDSAAVRGCTMNVGSGRTRGGAEGIMAIYNDGRDAQCELIVSHDTSSGKYVTYCKEWGQAVVWCTCGLPSIGRMIQCSICNHWEHALCAGYAADGDAADAADVIYSCHLCRVEHCISEADFQPRPLHRQQGRPERMLVLAIQFAVEDLAEWDEQLKRAEQQLLDSRTLYDICQQLLCLEQLLPATAKPTSWDERRAATWRATVQRAASPDVLWEAAAQLLQERLAFLPMPAVPPRERVPTAVEEIACEVCGLLDDDPAEGWDMLLCDSCPTGWHLACLTPPLLRPPEGDWACPRCSSGEELRAPSLELVDRQVRFVGSAGELLRGATGVCCDFVEAGRSGRAMYVVKLDVGVRFSDGITDTIIGVQDWELLEAGSGMPGPSQGWVTIPGTGVGVQRTEPAAPRREDVLVTCGGMRGWLSSGARQHEETVLCRIRSNAGGVGLVQLSPGSFRRLAGSDREDVWWGECLMHALTKQPVGAWLRARGGGYARIGQRLSVFWSIDDMYYSGWVAKYREQDAAHLLHYDDGEEEWVNLALQILKWESQAGATARREAEPSAAHSHYREPGDNLRGSTPEGIQEEQSGAN